MENKIIIKGDTVTVDKKIIKVTKLKVIGYTSIVYLSNDRKYFIKKVYDRPCKNYDCFKREIHLLKILNENVDWVPKLVSYDFETNTCFKLVPTICSLKH